jgi:succinyl-CoA synthetase beta subunit
MGNTGHDLLVIKAQVLAGGRGKGKFDSGFQGGVHMVNRSAVCASSLCFTHNTMQPRASQGICRQDDWF